MYQFQYGTLTASHANTPSAPAISTRLPKPKAPSASTQAATSAPNVSEPHCLTRFGVIVSFTALPPGW